MKKRIAVLTAFILLFEMIPFSSLAEREQPLTREQLTAAYALTGYGGEAGSLRSGLTTSSVQNMTALELRAYLDDILDSKIHSLENYYEDIENTLFRMEQEDPGSYALMTGGRFDGMQDTVHAYFREMEGVRMKLEYWTSQLEIHSGVISDNIDLLQNTSGTDYEIRLRNHRIRQSTEAIRSLRASVSEELGDCMTLLNSQLQEMTGSELSSGGVGAAASLGGWASELLSVPESVVQEAAFSSASLFPQKQTLLARLSPIATASADGNDAQLTVLRDTQNLIELKDSKLQAIRGASVKIVDIRNESAPKEIQGTTDAKGQMIFENAGFIMENNTIAFSMEVEAEGYQTAVFDEVKLHKGAKFLIFPKTMKQGEAYPYVAGCSFDGHDCLYDEYRAIRNDKNDRKNPVTVTVINPTDTDWRVSLVYQKSDNQQYYCTMGGSDGVIPANSRKTLAVEQQWRSLIKAGGNTFRWNLDGQTVSETDKYIIQLVIHGTGIRQDSFTAGSPALTSDRCFITPTMLTAEQAALEAPIINVSMTDRFFSQGMNFLNFSFPVADITKGKSSFFKSATVGLDFPFADIIPRISVALDGTASIIVGKDAGEFTDKKGPLYQWKSHDSKMIQEFQEKQDKSNTFMKKFDNGCTTNYLQRGMGLKLGKAQGTMGIFLGMTYRTEHEDGNPDAAWSSRNLAGVFGLVLSFAADVSYNTAIGPVPVTFGLSITASATFAFSFGGTIAINNRANLDEEAIQSCKWNPNISGFSVLINIGFTIFGGVGAKGFVSLTLNFYAGFNILMEFKYDFFFHLKIWYDLSLYVYLEMVFAHYKQNIFDYSDVVYDKPYPDGTSGSLTRVFSDLFVPRAMADEEAEMPPTVDATTLTAGDYPDLVAETEKVAGPIAHRNDGMKLLEIDGEVFAFHLVSEYGENKRTRVVWTNVNTGESGSFDDALRSAANRESLIRNPKGVVYAKNAKEQFSAADKYYQESNAVLYNQDDVVFDVIPFQIDNGKNEIRLMYRDLYMLTVFSADVSGSDGDGISVKGTPSYYMLGIRPDGKRGLTCSLRPPSVNLLYDPGLLWTMLYTVPATRSAEELEDAVLSGMSASTVFTIQDGLGWVFQTSFAMGGDLAMFRGQFPKIEKDGSKVELTGNYFCDRSLVSLDREIRLGVAPLTYGGEAYYSLEESADTPGTNILTYQPYYRSVIDQGVAIPFFRVLGTTQFDYVFYLTEEQGANGVVHHLKSAKIQHLGARTPPVYLLSDLDVTIPGARFSVQEVRGTVYIYWMEFTSEQNDSTRRIGRLRAVAFDPNACVASDDFVLAQFRISGEGSISDMCLTPNGRGYFVMDDAIWAFPFRLKAALDLEQICLLDDVVGEGENDMVSIRLVNNGNLAISAFTLTESAVEVVDQNGVVVPTGEETKILTIECNTLDPEQNRVHLEGDPSNLDITGKEAAWRTPLALDNITQDYWEVQQTERVFTGYDTFRDFEATASLDAMEILPGQVATFNIMIKVPSGWAGKTHRLKLSLQSYSASRNQVRSMALQGGLLDDSYALQGSDTLTYTRDGDGTMRMEGSSMLLNAGNSLFVNEVGAPLDAVVDHELDNLVVRGRVYRYPDGEKRLSITIANDTVDFDSIHLYCEVRYDGAESPVYMDLPYDPDSMAHSHTHTIDVPLSAIAGGGSGHRAEITIRGIGIEETTLVDNRFDVYLDDGDPLRIVVNPQDRLALEGETVTMTVQAAGGKTPYRYQWQEYMGESLGWRDIRDAASDTLVLEKVHKGMDARRYRCMVTDFNGDSVISGEALLTIRTPAPTGDPGLALLLPAAAALLLAWWLIRRKQQRGRRNTAA